MGLRGTGLACVCRQHTGRRALERKHIERRGLFQTGRAGLLSTQKSRAARRNRQFENIPSKTDGSLLFQGIFSNSMHVNRRARITPPLSCGHHKGPQFDSNLVALSLVTLPVEKNE